MQQTEHFRDSFLQFGNKFDVNLLLNSFIKHHRGWLNNAFIKGESSCPCAFFKLSTPRHEGVLWSGGIAPLIL
jgi:hypothetical protein